MSESGLLQGFSKQEPIPGYITKELLGAGGYGEVWKAHAPGGLQKAIKFICANGNSKRASRELCSLNRIKEVRHPFLLSIERIEVVDGNVVIVTELADQSLKRHYQIQRAKGFPGLPRDELLGYLRDVADALDYIYDNYSLQHLDIKPENLLLVGGRAKVGDFGLIKNLYDRSTSIVESLTPLYAPPELFDGKPHRHSDQYSLAIVYQEMLTGKLPFDGTTTAQLAAQHLHVAPLVSVLAKHDQPIVARALSKDPSQRFASCRALVEALFESRGGTTRQTPSGPFRNRVVDAPDAPLITATQTEEVTPGSTDVSMREAIAWSQTRSCQQLPAIESDDCDSVEYEPVLFIGIGGAATQVLQRLRRRLHDRIGAMNTIPAVDMLLIDTDVKNLNLAIEGGSEIAFEVDERLPMPLRPSEEYRFASGNIANSISRRWLYNVPYSLRTEGFRPLGRLAMVDHAQQLLQRLRQSLQEITSEDSTGRTSQTTGMQFATRQPRVFIVASIAGGTGGGMVLDVAYAVRTVLTELDLPDGNVHGVLLHSTRRGSHGRDKAVANTYATLSELWHYSRPGRCYPGDRACGLPPFHGNNRTFSSCYFVHLGDDLTELQFGAATDPVAEYLYASSLTPAARFLDKCRQAEFVRWGTELTEPVLRTFGLSQLGGSNSEIPVVLAELLCRDLVYRWRSGIGVDVGKTTTLHTITTALNVCEENAARPQFEKLDSQAQLKAVELGVDVEQLKRGIREIIDQELSMDIEAYCEQMVAAIVKANQPDDAVGNLANMVAAIDAALAGNKDTVLNSLNTILATRMEGRAAKVAASVRDWLFELVDEPDGTAGARHAAEWFQRYLRNLQAMSNSSANTLGEQALALHHAILRHGNDGRLGTLRFWPARNRSREIHKRLLEYARTQVEQAIACTVSWGLQLIDAQVTAELERLHLFWNDLHSLARAFHVPQSLDAAFEPFGGSECVPDHWRELLNELITRRENLVATLDRAIEDKLAVGRRKLRWYLTESVRIDSALLQPLRLAARQLILSTMQELNLSRLSGCQPESVESAEYQGCVEAAKPALGAHAVGSRLLLIVPQEINLDAVRQGLTREQQDNATIVCSPGGDFVACEEAELLEVRRVAAELVKNRRDFVEIAERLHTRTDVKWDDMLASNTRIN